MNEQIMVEIEAERRKEADGLEQCIVLMRRYIQCLRGEEVDMTGVGIQSMLVMHLENAMKCKVITEYQWDQFVEMQRQLQVYGK